MATEHKELSKVNKKKTNNQKGNFSKDMNESSQKKYIKSQILHTSHSVRKL